MGKYFVSSEWPGFFAPSTDTIKVVDVDEVLSLELPNGEDALSNPSPESLQDSGLSLWPRGAAWGSPDGEAVSRDSVIAKLTLALLSPFAELYKRVWQLTLESRSASIVDSLDDWERDYGLPDPCNRLSSSSIETRKNTLRERVRGLELNRPDEVVRMADRLGFVIAVYEPSGFNCGQSRLGNGDRVSAFGLGRQWAVLVYAAPFKRFQTGISQTGINRLLEFNFELLTCAIERYRPAWSKLSFNFSERIQAYNLIDEGGAFVITENGENIVALARPSNINS